MDGACNIWPAPSTQMPSLTYLTKSSKDPGRDLVFGRILDASSISNDTVDRVLDLGCSNFINPQDHPVQTHEVHPM